MRRSMHTTKESVCKTALAIVLAPVLVVPPVGAAEYFVAKRGSDQADGRRRQGRHVAGAGLADPVARRPQC